MLNLQKQKNIFYQFECPQQYIVDIHMKSLIMINCWSSNYKYCGCNDIKYKTTSRIIRVRHHLSCLCLICPPPLPPPLIIITISSSHSAPVTGAQHSNYQDGCCLPLPSHAPWTHTCAHRHMSIDVIV